MSPLVEVCTANCFKVRPQQPRTLIINKTSVEILDQWGRLKEHRGVSEANVRLQYPSLPQPLSRSNVVTLSVHCECTLVSAVVSRYLQTGIPIDVKIGISRRLCAWCDAFMVTVRKRYPAISITTTARHGKNFTGWTIPPLAPQELIDDMQSFVEALVREICGKTNRMWPPDSEPRFAVINDEYRASLAAAIRNSPILKQFGKRIDPEV